MNTAQRIRSRRIELAFSEAALASELGISVEAYGDLEQHQDELATCLTLGEATRLSALLDMPLHELLAAPSSSAPSPRQVAEQVAMHLASTGRTLESLEERLGWELRTFLADPLTAAQARPIMFFQALAEELQASPFSLVPQLHAA